MLVFEPEVGDLSPLLSDTHTGLVVLKERGVSAEETTNLECLVYVSLKYMFTAHVVMCCL